MQRDLRWLLAGLGLGASALALTSCDSPDQHGSQPGTSVTAVPLGSDGERIHPPEGKWCSKPDVAKGLVILGSPNVGDCPKFLDGARIPKEKELAPEYIDMPRSTYGFYDDILTKMRRSAINHAPLCCYTWREKTPGGRPLVERGAPDVAVVAPLLPEALEPARKLELLQPPGSLTHQVFEHWHRQAQLEHASVASFSRARLELIALGAPRLLVAGYARAAQDEVRHAQLALGALAAWGAPTVHFGPISIPAASHHARYRSRGEALAALARRTLDEAFEPEAAAAIALFEAARLAACPNLSRVLAAIADDERRHARLALDTVRWCLEETDREPPSLREVATTANVPTHQASEWGVIADATWAATRQSCRALTASLLG